MRLVRPCLVAAVTTAVLVATLSVSPASAREASPLETRQGGDHFPATISTTVPPGGSSMITTPTLGKDVKTLKVTVKAKSPDELESETFDKFVNTVGSLTKGQRLLVCTMMYELLVFPEDAATGEFDLNASNATIAGAVLLACLQYAGLLDGASNARSSAADGKCGQVRPSLPATVTKVSGGYSLSASGTSKPARRPKVKIKCQKRGDTMTYKIRAAKKGTPLRKAVGKKLSIGIKSPADAQTSVPVQITFSTP